MYRQWVVTALLAWPALAALVVLLAPVRWAKHLALAASLIEFAISVPLWWTFAPAGGMQFMRDASWIPSWGIRYTVGVDGISLSMVLLTTFLVPLSVLGSYAYITTRQRGFYALMLVLTTGMIGVFVALDLFLFYVMWEVMLIPMYFIIGVWGGERRLYAAIKFFVYTFLGSLLMLVAILALVYLVGQRTGVYSFSYTNLTTHIGGLGTLAFWLFGAFFLAFAIKVPMFPFHTWLPDAHVEAPTAGSVLLAGVLLKMGTYGFLRFALPLFPAVALHPAVQRVIVALSLIGILYGGLVAMVQPDFKKLIAYSSVAHLGFVVLGIWALTLQSVQGALLVMINHGISTGALFFLAGMLYERRHSRLIEAFGGIAKVVPMLAAVLTIVSLSSIGLPATNGFVGEFLVLLGTFRTYPLAAIIATAGVVVAAMYLLPALQRVIFNPLDKSVNEKLVDLSFREIAVLVPLLACIVWIGVYPKPILQRMEPSARELVQSVRLDLANSRDLLRALLPELALTLAGLVLLIVIAWRHRTAADLRVAGWVTLAGLAAAGVATWWLWWHTARAIGAPAMIAVDDFRFVADWLLLGTAGLTVLVSFDYLERERLLAPEYYALLLFATLGAMVMVGGEDLMVVFLGLELMSVAVYALAGINRHSAAAALKYFLLGAFASGFLLYGIALVYGATATTNLSQIGVQVRTLGLNDSPMLLIGLGLLLVGFGFKVAAVPFHMWAPDVYDGSPTPVTGYMATAVKAAAFAALLRVLGEAFGGVPAWHQIVWWLAV